MKKMMIYLMIVVTLMILPSPVFAFASAIHKPSATPLNGTESMVSTILGVIQWIGYAISLGMLIYIGIKYTMSAANEKADLKSASINFVIGAIIIAGASAICGWVVTAFQEADTGASLSHNTAIYEIV